MRRCKCTIKEDHLSRFKEVAKGLGLSKLIANKLANFIHYEVQMAKKSRGGNND